MLCVVYFDYINTGCPTMTIKGTSPKQLKHNSVENSKSYSKEVIEKLVNLSKKAKQIRDAYDATIIPSNTRF